MCKAMQTHDLAERIERELDDEVPRPVRAQIAAVIELLDGGATLPFIARYRKERTGGLDEVAIGVISDARDTVQAREARRDTIRTSLQKQGVLTPDLAARLEAAATPAELEDLYAPYKPRRRTRATVAIEAGLAPLAQQILLNLPQAAAEADLEALAAARDIVAEWIAEHPEIRAAVRQLFEDQAQLAASRKRGVKAEGRAQHYKDYFDHREPAAGAPSHRILAMLRGERQGFLSVSVRPSEATVIDIVTALVMRCKVRWDQLGEEFAATVTQPYSAPCAAQIEPALRDGCTRLLIPSLENEQRAALKRRADATAISIFARNLEELLMAPPLPDSAILAIDPGLRTGCKVVCLDSHAELLSSDTIFPLPPHNKTDHAAETIRELVLHHQIGAVAVGNGTGGRQVQSFIEALELDIAVVSVNESGASVYSASALAREELPEHDVTVRGAVSIGRRLADPLSELVKIEPRSIGVGQYQHDVDQKALRKALDEVVVRCVNRVGVDLNGAGISLISYVAGLGPRLARAVVEYRGSHGRFSSRRQLLEVPGLGARAFEQCAGFLRISGGDEPLDAGAVHPERYELVRSIASDLGVTVSELLTNPEARAQIDPQRYLGGDVGLATLNDIISELERPGRDPRGVFEPLRFADVHSLEDLAAGMRLPGIVTNIAAFGAFVDIGVHQDGLVHISQLADRFVRDPHEVVAIGEAVTVTVLAVDTARRRISLSLIAAQTAKPDRKINH